MSDKIKGTAEAWESGALGRDAEFVRVNKQMINVRFNHELAKVPTRSDVYAAGFDLYSVEEIDIQPGCWHPVNTGISMQHKHEGFYFKIAARSGLAAKHGLTTIAETVDNNYDGDIKVVLINLGNKTASISVGQRIGQVIPVRYDSLSTIEVVNELPRSRGGLGFGSTGQ